MTDEMLSKFVTMAGPLAGAIVGGLISGLSTWGLERQKWRRDSREKLLSLTRDATSRALEWIEPMRNAEAKASLLVMAAIQGDSTDEQFLKNFPYLVGELSKWDLPGNLRAVLPSGTYTRGHQIVRMIEELRPLGVRYGQEARRTGLPMAGLEECNARLNAIGKLINKLETELQAAFLKTFE